jgi:hypothetical protein
VLERGTHVYREATGVLLQHSSFNTLVGLVAIVGAHSCRGWPDLARRLSSSPATTYTVFSLLPVLYWQAHNTVAWFNYSCVSGGWTWGYAPSRAHDNRVRWNHVHHCGLGELSDLAGVYWLVRWQDFVNFCHLSLHMLDTALGVLSTFTFSICSSFISLSSCCQHVPCLAYDLWSEGREPSSHLPRSSHRNARPPMSSVFVVPSLTPTGVNDGRAAAPAP